jgi:hypothetical protein
LGVTIVIGCRDDHIKAIVAAFELNEYKGAILYPVTRAEYISHTAVGKRAHREAVDGKGSHPGGREQAKEVSSFHVDVKIFNKEAVILG